MEKNIITTTYYETPCGRMILGSLNNHLCLCDWRNGKDRKQIDNRLKRLLKADYVEGNSDVLTIAIQQLDEFFANKRKTFTIPLLLAGTDFQKSVWTELQRVPFGQTISYAQIAANIGRPLSARAVANANGANAMAIFIPCHRVIGSDNSLTGYAGGLDTKRYLLQIEGWYN